MSVHPSLRQAGGKSGIVRNVLKRHERLRDLLSHDRFADGASVYGLPKTKQIRIKVRKAAKEAPAEGAPSAPSGGKPPAGGKPAAGAAASSTPSGGKPAAGKASAGGKAPAGDKPAGKSA
jgi:small basic protein (TIGR04137 family)